MNNRKISEGELDRISELPDNVLSHILSFLPSKEAIATCLLCKRWRYVWKMVPAMDFVCLPHITVKAHTMVSEFLRLCGTKRITRFHVKCSQIHSHQCRRQRGLKGPCCLEHLQEFVDAAIDVKVEELSISMAGYRSHEPVLMPINVFACTAIVTLKLEGPFIVHIPSSAQLPSLNVEVCEPSFEKFLSRSPALEVFYLKEKEERNSDLDFPQFSNLVDLELHLRGDVVSLPMTLLTCATIVTLKIKGPFTLSVPSGIKLPSLKNLHLNVRKCELASCKEFLSGSPALEVFYLKEEDDSYLDFPEFPNLVHFELHLGDNDVSLPITLLTCATIVTMKIEGPSTNLSVPSGTKLPSLKSLHLNVRKCEPASCKELLSGSPALEVFYLKELDNSSLDFPQFSNLVQLELHLTKDAVSLPITLLTCATIVKIKIEGPSTNLSVPSGIELPSLKSLHLNVRKCELASCKEFLSGSPALKVFYLKENVDNSCFDFQQFHTWVPAGVVSLPMALFTCNTIVTMKMEGPFTRYVPSGIELPSLETLDPDVRKCLFDLKKESRGFEELRIERNSHGNLIVSKDPFLTLVIRSDCDHDYVQDYLEGHWENVVKAKVSMTLNNKHYIRNIVHSHAFSILKSIPNVEFLSLHDPLYCDMDNSSLDLPQFPNLVRLDLHVAYLHHSPYLKLPAQCPKLEMYCLNDKLQN